MPDGGGTLDLNACCAVTYGHPLARALLGDSLHPGGLALTSRLAALMGIGATSNVLDAGSGLGATPVHLAHSKGCRVTAVTLEREGAVAGADLRAGKAWAAGSSSSRAMSCRPMSAEPPSTPS